MDAEQAYAELSSAGWEVHRQLPSTQSLALERLSAGNPTPVVVAVEQTAGTGRHGRVWGSPPGGLWFSLTTSGVRLRPEGLPLLAALAVARVVRVLGPDPWIRWPNDVMLGERKLAGILVDARWLGSQGTAVVGIGLNVDIDPPPELRGVATSLTEQGILRPHLGRLLGALLEEWTRLLQQHSVDGLEPLHSELTRLVIGPERNVEVHLAGHPPYRDRMTALGLDGSLLLASGKQLASVERLLVL